ncbi:hypothetical protein SETIT_9G544800v2 [Setaria italica]|uniref:Uncharacterized protein n=1 Tax=Setaria italica TaxID=4555 RepID=A0A368SVZ5_SETIT|nr:uncharacterized protein LOC101779203 [Setaria italica]RCV46607.1 hypothetical protein SETIT_9G544800v2 [Setaria italica]
MGSEAAAAPVEISSDEEDDVKAPAAAAAGKRKSPEGALDWAEQMAEKMLAEEDFGVSGAGLVDPAAVQELLDSLMDATGIVMGDKESAVVDKNSNSVRDGEDEDNDDDCVILDGDPDKPVAVAKEEGPRRDAAEDELQIVAEKGEIACRDFPHPRHLCATLPFSTSSHARHCNMCHCYVCDSPAPCAFWGKGTAHTDHCHATDKDAKWKKLRQSSKNKSQPSPKRRSIHNFYQSSTTGASSQSSANVNGSTGRFPIPTVLARNQQVDPSIMAPWDRVQGMSLMRAPSPMPRARIPSYGSKSAPVAPPVYTPSNSNHLQPSGPSYVPMQPAQPHAFQTAQVPPGDRVSAGTFQSYQPQPHSGAPIGFQGDRYRPLSYPQPPPNMLVGTGVPLSRSASVASQGTQYQQVPPADARLKEKEKLASLARKLGVSDYNTYEPLGQQSASTPQSLHPSQLLAQAKARQWVQAKKSYVAATPQMRSSSGHNSSNHASGGTVLSSGSIQIQQPLCQLNSQSSRTLSGTTPSNLLDGK